MLTEKFMFKTLSTIALVLCGTGVLVAQKDPGVRGGAPGAGSSVQPLTPAEIDFFNASLVNFQLVDSVSGGVPGTGGGLGPRFNADACAVCHTQPAIGGTSPANNPLIAVANKNHPAGSTQQTIPPFITANGPIREAHFKFFPRTNTRDGSQHDLFTITGRADAPGCILSQPDFATAIRTGNLSLRIPSPLFGDGLLESISDTSILSAQREVASRAQSLGISGHPNIDGSGFISRFGWKAQLRSLQEFAGLAYNGETGVSNELFPDELSNPPASCIFNALPEDVTNFNTTSPASAVPSDIVRFATFMRLLDQPTPACTGSGCSGSIQNGNSLFNSIGCAVCHTPSMTSGNNGFLQSTTALSNVQVNLFSDLLVHHMGPALSDELIQGAAGPDEFRSAPLWGLGQRIFFLHDGRTTDLLQAIQAHRSFSNNTQTGAPNASTTTGTGTGSSPSPSNFDSEANAVIANFNALTASQKQDILNFLRSL